MKEWKSKEKKEQLVSTDFISPWKKFIIPVINVLYLKKKQKNYIVH